MTRVKRAPLADQAAEILLDRIRSGEWSLGEKLPGETSLAPQLGVGRSTVREAIRQLVGRGVLTTRQGSGIFVTALDAPEDWDAILTRSGIVAVIEARIAIESEAAALAAERRTPADLRAITRALALRGEHRTQIDSYVDTDTAFHRAIVAAAHNPILLEVFDTFTPRLRAAMIDLLRIRGDHGSDPDQITHDELLGAIARRDAAAAAALSRAHLSSLKASLA